MPKPPVLLNLPLPDFIEQLFLPHCEFKPWHWLTEGDGDAEQLAAIQALVIYGHTRVDEAVLAKVPTIKVISNFGVGVDHIDIAACARRGVPVGNTPGAVDGATADLTMALLLASARNIVSGDRFARRPEWRAFNPSELPGKEVYGSTLGIVGLGRVGRQVAKRARGFEMKILYYRRDRDFTAERELGVEYADLDSLLGASDYVTLNVPLTSATRHLIGAAQLRKMRPDAILINSARGGVVDHAALYRALSENWIAAAAVDVTEPEPLPRDHPLLSLDNLIITPHLGSATRQTRAWMGRMMLENLLAGLNGQSLPYLVRA